MGYLQRVSYSYKFIYETKQQISQFKGVYWHKQNGKWYAHLNLKGGIQKSGGYFKNELDAAMRVNQLYEELRIPLQNLGIGAIPTKQNQVT